MARKITAAAAPSPEPKRRKLKKGFMNGIYDLAKQINEYKKLLRRLRSKKPLTPDMIKMISKWKKKI